MNAQTNGANVRKAERVRIAKTRTRTAPIRTPRSVAKALGRALRAGPVMSGEPHPADDAINRALRDDPNGLADAALARVMRSDADAALAARLLHLLGRVPRKRIGVWGAKLAEAGVRHASPWVRDAAVTMIDLWGDRRLVHLLTPRPDEELPIARYMWALRAEFRRGGRVR